MGTLRVAMRWVTFVMVAGVVGIGAAGCGSSDSGAATTAAATGSSTTGAAPAKLTVAAYPLTQLMLPYIAQSQGDYAEQKLDVKLDGVSGGAAQLLPAVLSNKFQVGVSGLADILPAIVKGAPVELLPGFGTVIEPSLATATNVIVAKDSSVRKLADLQGKRVALNSLGSAHELFLKLEMEQAGLDPSSVKFVQVPFANIVSAIDKGQVDAGQLVDPLLTQAQTLGMHGVVAIGAAVASRLPSAVYWVSKSWAKSHPQEIAAFTKAMASAASALEKDPELMRASMRKNTPTPPKIIDKVKNFGAFTTDVTPETIAKEAKILHDGGLIAKDPPTSDYVYGAK
jgi:NitT/TauT family transport system substrate-binding protein